ncbi:transmembrane and immunoglobulin domain-containing protein 1 [Labrus bergylta]|uniref:Transmembrane and immunoglobulin domain containing 1 n=1 Tax=Labrus bergylta TaxID=56723 RepID=A0A3Q3FH95_9LABR|nr:transmembrane and immunoglobulin domain-containing protein 1-like [Labrus bergylta]XP_020508626.1 transmembrane and immunoglobulin domain-containing protein 1-like [Labrus bergylta]
MKLMYGPPLFHLLLYFASHTLGVRIESVPAVNSDGLIQMELEQSVSLVCQPEGVLETDEELVWLRNGAAVSLKEGNTKGRSQVCVTPVISGDNEATFTCHLRKNATISASVTLNVTYPPQLSGSQEISIEEEETLVLGCDIWANPQVSSLSWMLNGSTVDLLEGVFTVTNDGFTSQLSTNRVEKNLHEGTYQCIAHSSMYGRYDQVFYVTVTERTIKFPLMPLIAGLVVVFLTTLLAVASRWKNIRKCCK